MKLKRLPTVQANYERHQNFLVDSILTMAARLKADIARRKAAEQKQKEQEKRNV